MLFVDLMLLIIGVSVFSVLKSRDKRDRQEAERELREFDERQHEFMEKNVEKREDWSVYDDIKDFCFWLDPSGEMVSPIEATDEVKEYYNVAYEIAKKTQIPERSERYFRLSDKNWIEHIMCELAIGARLGKVNDDRKTWGYRCGETEIGLWIYRKSHDKFTGRLMQYHGPNGAPPFVFWEYGDRQYFHENENSVTAVEI